MYPGNQARLYRYVSKDDKHFVFLRTHTQTLANACQDIVLKRDDMFIAKEMLHISCPYLLCRPDDKLLVSHDYSYSIANTGERDRTSLVSRLKKRTLDNDEHIYKI